MIRKGQMQGVNKGDVTGQVAFIASLFGVAAEAQEERGHPAHSVPQRFFATQPYLLEQNSCPANKNSVR